MKGKVLLERFPYRFVGSEERGWVEKYDLYTKRYSHMYEVACERQMAVLMEDLEYCKWLDPSGVNCYVPADGVIKSPYLKS